MELIEIRIHVGGYLSPQDLAICTQVCKEWHSSFTPLLYQRIDLSASAPGVPEGALPGKYVLARNASYIKDLSLHLHSSSAPSLIKRATNLQRLIIRPEIGQQPGGGPGLIAIKCLLKNNPRLRSLHVCSPGNFFASYPFLLDLSTYLPPKLQELRITYSTFDFAYLAGLSTLTLLDLQDCHIEVHRTEVPMDGTTLFPVLETLRLHGRDPDWIPFLTLDWTAECPRLKHLTVMAYEHMHRKPWSIQFWSPSQTLETLNHSIELNDAGLAGMMEKFPRLTSFRTWGGAVFGEKSFWTGMMIGMWSSMKELKVGHGQKDHPWAMMAILSACPNLTSLHCHRLDADDLVKVTESIPQISHPAGQGSGPVGQDLVETATKLQWVCKNLEVLSVESLSWSVDQDQNRQMHEELKALKSLNSLSITTNPCQDEYAPRTIGQDYSDSDAEEEEQSQVQDPIKLWVRAKYNRSQLERRPRMRWMARAWPKLQLYSNGTHEVDNGVGAASY